MPKKWDLADELPNSIKHINLNEIIDNSRKDGLTIGDRLGVNQGNYNDLGKGIYEHLGPIDILVAQGRIDKAKYASRLIYNDTIVAIAKSKDINLGKIKDHREFIDAITSLQQEYQYLHREYNGRTGIESNIKIDLNAGEQLAYDLVRDTSVLHQVQLGLGKLTKTHTEHIEKIVNTEISKMQRFTDSDREHIADNTYKIMNSNKWREQLDIKNNDLAKPVIAESQAISAEIKYINSNFVEISKAKENAKSPEEVISVIVKEQDFLNDLHNNIKYPKHHGDELHRSIAEAKVNKEANILADLKKALGANRKQGVKSNKELVDILRSPKARLKDTCWHLDEMAKDERHEVLQWYKHELTSLEKMGSKIDFDKLVSILLPMPRVDRKEYINAITAAETKKYVEPLLTQHAQEKAKATNIKELMTAIEKEQATYVHLHNDHGMAIYALDKSNGNMKLSILASAANDLHKCGGIGHAQEAIDHAIEHKITTDDKMFAELKNNGSNMRNLSEDLYRECRNHHRYEIDRHLKDFDHNRNVYIEHHRFTDPASYLHHLKEHHNHSFMPMDHIDKHLQHIQHQHEQEIQKEPHINRSMGGPSL